MKTVAALLASMGTSQARLFALNLGPATQNTLWTLCDISLNDSLRFRNINSSHFLLLLERIQHQFFNSPPV